MKIKCSIAVSALHTFYKLEVYLVFIYYYVAILEYNPIL